MPIVGFEKLSLVDYENKICATLFYSGCNFRCPFCHNGELVLNPNSVKPIPLDEIFTYLVQRNKILDAVCITGGEPTLDPGLKDLILEIKKIGLKVKLDTNGTNPALLKELIDEHLIDFVAMDIKNDKENYAKTCSLQIIDLHKIEESVNILKSSNVDYEFRTTIISEYHQRENIINIAKWLIGAKSFRLQHFVEREGCIKHGLHEIAINDAEEYLKIMKEYIPNSLLRGY